VWLLDGGWRLRLFRRPVPFAREVGRGPWSARSLGSPNSREGRVGDERGVRTSSSWPLHRRVHAESREFGRRNRRSGVGPELRFRKRAAHCRSSASPRRGTPEQGRRCAGNHEASETPPRVRDDRLQGVPGLRVGCTKSGSDVRSQQVPPVAAGGIHGDLARGQSRRHHGCKPEAPKAPTRGEKASSVIAPARPSGWSGVRTKGPRRAACWR
jgi:hypothetical protein